MPGKTVRLKGKLEGVEVTLDDGRKIIKVTKNGKTILCEETQFGLICDPQGIPGPDKLPVLQFRVSKTGKSLFARVMPESTGGLESAGRPGFQRHAL